MKVLIAVVTCARYYDRRNAVRDTWMPWVTRLNPENVDVMFFSGKEPCLVDDSVGDIVHLDCPDTYNELPQKTLKLVEYSRENGYDLLIKVDDDTYFLPLPEYIAEFAEYACMGSVRQHPPHNDMVPYAQGGCYGLTERGMDAVLNSPEHPIKHTKLLFQTGLEDGAVGKALKTAGIVPQHAERIKTVYQHGVPAVGNDIISAHACPPEKLREIHDRNILALLSHYSQVMAKTKPDELQDIRITPQPTTIGKEGVTICITSCGRHDLLKKTMESLAASVIDYPIYETIVWEDSNAKKPEWIDSGDNPLSGLGRIRWISNGKRCGQWISIDRMYDLVETEFIFHCEDDWGFDGRAFMAESVKILQDHPNVIQVSLRGDDNTSGHPNVDDPETCLRIQERYWREYWGGLSGNPGVRRRSDWQKIGSYGKVTGYGHGGIVPEQTLSKLYLDMGYRIAVLPGGPYVKHLGERRSKAIDPLPKRPKILVAIPACHKYEYGQHANDLKNGIKRETQGRIQALRDTWINDIAPFSVYVDYKFFFGRTDDKDWKPKPDEVFLNVPDDYHSLPHKMKAIYQYALQHGYDYVVKCDDDTWIDVARLMRCGFDQCDQMGFLRCRCRIKETCNHYVTGMCYTLSRRAMMCVVASTPNHWAEDYWVGTVLRKHGIRPVGHPGWCPGFDSHFVDIGKLPEGVIAAHAVKADDMRRLYESGSGRWICCD